MPRSTELWGSSRFAFFITLVALIAIQALLARPILNTLMLENSRTPAARWATHILDEVSKAYSVGTAQTGYVPGRYDILIGSLSAALSTTTINQIDVVRLDCMCTVSFGQGMSLSDAMPNGTSVGDALALALNGEVPNGYVIRFGEELVPSDAASLDGVALTGRPSLDAVPMTNLASAIFYSNRPDQPEILVRLIKDLSAGANLIKLWLGLLGIIVTSVLLAVFLIANRLIKNSQTRGKMSAERARFLAERDPLTGLYNRLGFRNRSGALLQKCQSEGRRACLIQYDANNLKSINDLHGHPTGDRCLVDIAKRIRATYPEDALMARLGSDEFAVLVEEIHLPKEIGPVKASAIDEAAHDLAVSTTVGFAFYPDDGPTLFQLMKAADLALSSAKALSRDSVVAYSSNMSDSFRKKAWEIKGIRDAIATDQIEPYYQPLVNARTLELEGLETLVRWNHPELGTLTPGSFESALSDPSVAVDITESVLELMLADIRSWWSQGYRFSAGLNISEYDLRNPGLFDMINSKLDQYNLPPPALAIEVTESAVNGANLHAVVPILQAFRNRGLPVALDDFGTGTSSLTLLRTLPRTAIKIDKSFVGDIVHDPEDRAIVKSLTHLGHDLNIKVVAEGIEDESQVELLRDLGVDIFQGFLFGKPQTAKDISNRLGQWSIAPFQPHSQPPTAGTTPNLHSRSCSG